VRTLLEEMDRDAFAECCQSLGGGALGLDDAFARALFDEIKRPPDPDIAAVRQAARQARPASASASGAQARFLDKPEPLEVVGWSEFAAMGGGAVKQATYKRELPDSFAADWCRLALPDFEAMDALDLEDPEHAPPERVFWYCKRTNDTQWEPPPSVAAFLLASLPKVRDQSRPPLLPPPAALPKVAGVDSRLCADHPPPAASHGAHRTAVAARNRPPARPPAQALASRRPSRPRASHPLAPILLSPRPPTNLGLPASAARSACPVRPCRRPAPRPTLSLRPPPTSPVAAPPSLRPRPAAAHWTSAWQA
jgi:hypothetical protein